MILTILEYVYRQNYKSQSSHVPDNLQLTLNMSTIRVNKLYCTTKNMSFVAVPCQGTSLANLMRDTGYLNLQVLE